MKKWMGLLLAMMMIVAASGCSKDTATSKEEPKSETSQSGETKKSGDTKEPKEKEPPVVINWLTNTEVLEKSDGILQVEEKYNCEFNFVYLDKGRYLELLGVKLASNEVPDVFSLAQDTSIQPYIRQGVAAEITDEMFSKLPDYLDGYKDFNTDGNLFIDTMYDGKVYGLKAVNFSASYPTVLVWNKKWLKNVGIDKIPRTLDEFEEAMYKFAHEDPDGNNVKDTYGMSQSVMNAVFGAYGPVPLKEFRGKGRQKCFMYEEEKGQLDFAVVQPEMKEALGRLQKWYADGIIDPEFITGENTGGYWAISQAFVNQKVGVTGMVMSYHYIPPMSDDPNDLGGAVYREYMKVHPDAVYGEDFEIGPAIVGPNGNAGTHTWGSRGGKVIITTKAAEDQRKIDVLLQLINDNAKDFDQATLLSYGVKDKHYTISDTGIYLSNEDNGNVGLGLLSFGADPYNAKIYNPVQVNFMEKYRSEGYEDSIYPTVEGHAKYTNDLNRLSLESYIDIITGEKDLDYFDEFVKEFNKTGGEEIRSEINKAYKEILGN